MKKFIIFMVILFSLHLFAQESSFFTINDIYYMIGDSKTDSQGKPSFITDKKTIWSSSKYSDFKFPENARTGWIMFYLPKTNYKNPSLYFDNLPYLSSLTNQNFEIYIEDQLFYKFGKINTIDYNFGKPMFFFKLPDDYHSKRVFIRINRHDQIHEINGSILIGSHDELFKIFLLRNADLVLIGFFLMISSLIMIPFLYLQKKGGKLQFFNIIIFTFSIGLFNISKSQIILQFFSDYRIPISLANNLSTITILITLPIFFINIFENGKYWIIDYMIKFEIIYGSLIILIRTFIYNNGLELMPKKFQFFFEGIHESLFYYQYTHILFLFSVIMFVIAFKISIKDKHVEAVLFNIGLSTMILFSIIDVMVFSNIMFLKTLTAHYGMFIFTGIVFFLFIYKSANTIEMYSKELQKRNLILKAINTAQSYFVPSKFMHVLGLKKITEITLGKQINRNMTVLFSDIKNFTAISETMSPEENFNFINQYLKIIGPIIRSYNGVIDKYTGDGIMALFDNSTDALTASIIIKKMFTKNPINNLFIEIGTSINTGDLMLGIIGDESRMEVTVISDTVNLASRMQEIVKKFEAPIVISSDTLYGIDSPDLFKFRYLGNFKVRGKNEPVSTFEILEGNDENILNLKLLSKDIFEKGIFYYLNNDIKEALSCFERSLEIYPNDKTAIHYLEMCRNNYNEIIII